jgi:hypothetical protein
MPFCITDQESAQSEEEMVLVCPRVGMEKNNKESM